MDPSEDTTEVTQLLRKVSRGEASSAALFPIVYDELRALAARHLSRERPEHTLQATALVHEAYLRLVDLDRMDWRDRVHFFAAASGSIRRILVDHARAKGRQKRGGNEPKLPLKEALAIPIHEPGPELVELDDAMCRLAEDHPEKARVVELRYFGGLTVAEIAEVLGVKERTVDRYWFFARNWLFRELTEGTAGPDVR
ncbi:MAG: sigma-70 family RNA polymerase sigma factor [Candidatus Eisenbacteria bacterium]|uniref:Sigma-70 family RNA polymerase sigma factor n=1 Tax=Eiseniibacteriota bacterium TaxID=2212470 RepID=A0A956RRX1_UNCEI|nr:sigma-70 family RNA polymerase sigma factor [Candidatus Eisenbacteria bacterium]